MIMGSWQDGLGLAVLAATVFFGLGCVFVAWWLLDRGRRLRDAAEHYLDRARNLGTPSITLRIRVGDEGEPLFHASATYMHWQAKHGGSLWHEVIRTADGLLVEVTPIYEGVGPVPDLETLLEREVLGLSDV